MNKISLAISAVLMTVLLFSPNKTYSQTVVFDGEIYWDWPPNANYGGYGFYWWHRLDGVNNVEYGDMSSTDWTSPNNYYTGEFRMRFEVLEQPTNEPFDIQFGIWQDYSKGTNHPETVASRKRITKGTVYEGSLGRPDTWWNKEPGDLVDFSRPEDFYRIGIVLWNTDPLCIPMGTEWNSEGCPENEYKFFPMRARVTITAYPGSGGTVIYPPSYSIDYFGERTSTPVSTQDQYSFDNTNFFDGNNAPLNLTPGQTVYFRKKADYSKNQTLNVPSRPPTPVFSVDYFNEQTVENVSSQYDYSSSSDMSSSTSGSGNKVDLTPGEFIFFRVKATSSSFRSSIQTLSVPDRPSPPSLGIDFENERTSDVVSSSIEYSTTGPDGALTSGSDDYVDISPGASLYLRKKATNNSFRSDFLTLEAPQRPGAPAYTIDFMGEATMSPVSSGDEYSYDEQMADAVSGTDTKINLEPGDVLYFRTKATGSSYSSDVQTLTVPLRPDPPTVTIDFIGEMTSEAVGTDEQYADNAEFSSSQQGEDQKVDIAPGDVLFFRKAPSEEQFASEAVQIQAPLRPVVTANEGDTTEMDPFILQCIFFQDISDLDPAGLTALNATIDNVGLVSSQPGNTVYNATIDVIEEGLVTLRLEANAAAEGNFRSEPYEVYYKNTDVDTTTNTSFLLKEDQIILYPNPSDGNIVISFPYRITSKIELQVYSSAGAVVFTKSIEGIQEINLNMDQLELGTYMIHLNIGPQQYRKKIVIQR